MFQQSKFTINLTKEQKEFINNLLPTRYTLQTNGQHQQPKSNSKAASLRKIEISVDENKLQISSSDHKRRKIKNADQVDAMEKRSSLGKKEEIIKKWSMVKKMKKHQSSWPFRNPVNIKTHDVPNYHQIIPVSMDLHTIQQKFKNDQYEHPSEVERDIGQILLNSYKFNQKNQTYFQATRQFQKLYLQLNKQSDEKNRKELPDRNKKKQEAGHSLSHNNHKHSEFANIQKSIFTIIKRMQQIPLKKKQKASSHCNIRYSKQQNSMSVKQKRELAQQIRQITNEQHLLQILRIIRKYVKNEKESKKQSQNLSFKSLTSLQQINEHNQFEFISLDLQKIDAKGLRQVQNYLKILKNKKNLDMVKQQSAYSHSIYPNSVAQIGSQNSMQNF